MKTTLSASRVTQRPHKDLGFTLIELLVVIGIVAILASLIIAILPSIKTRGNLATSLNNLRQLGAALQGYAGENDMSLPRRSQGDADRWPNLLLTYLGNHEKVYAEPADPNNFIKTGKNPLSNGRNHTSYIINGFNDAGAFEDENVVVRTNRLEAPSQTILMATQSGSGNFYMDFAEGNQNSVLNKEVYGDAATYLFADGSARLLRSTGDGEYNDRLWLISKSSEIPPTQ